METQCERGGREVLGRAKNSVSQLQKKKSMKLLIDFLQRVLTTRTYNHLDLASFGIVGLFFCPLIISYTFSFSLSVVHFDSVLPKVRATDLFLFLLSFFWTFNVNELLSTTLIVFAKFDTGAHHAMAKWLHFFTFHF